MVNSAGGLRLYRGGKQLKSPWQLSAMARSLPCFGMGKVRRFALEDRLPPPPRCPYPLAALYEKRNPGGYHGWTFDGAAALARRYPTCTPMKRGLPRYAARPTLWLQRNGFLFTFLVRGR